MEWIDTLIGLAAGGGLVGIFTIPSAIKKAKAEAKEPEIEAWKKLVDELQEQNNDMKGRVEANEKRIDELNLRIDDLYRSKAECNEANNKLAADVAKLETLLEIEKPKLCMVQNCPKREPQSGY